MSPEQPQTFAWEERPDAASPLATLRGAAHAATASTSLPPLLSGPNARYVEADVLGEGGMAIVRAAEDEVLDREVAVKRPKAGLSAAARDAILVEARTMARLDHPNIVPVYALGVDADGAPVVVMKRVRGTPWSGRLGAPGGLERDLDVLIEVAQAVQFAHARGVLHRDIKPDNVMIGAFGEVYLMDWGCATPVAGARTDPMVGTPAWMAPEMATPGAPVGPWTDVFLLGATLHRVVAGAPRHAGASVSEVLDAARRAAPARYGPEVSVEMAALINRCCAANPAARPSDVGEFLDALREVRAHEAAVTLARRALRAAEALERAAEGNAREAEALFEATRAAARAARELWPDCPEAWEAWRRANAALLPVRLAAGEVAWVEAALREDGDEEAARWAGPVTAARARRDAESARLAAVDVGFAARERAQAMTALLGIGCLSILAVRGQSGGQPLTAAELVQVAFVGQLFVVGVMIPFRRRIFGNEASRALMVGVMLTTTASLVHRIGGWLSDAEVGSTLGADMVMHAACICMLALQVEPRLGWAAVPFLVGAAASALQPELASSVFPVADMSAVAMGALVFWWRARATE